jgi:hypothetical protein
MVATMTSVEPRAFMPVPSASASPQPSPPSVAPRKAPPNFPNVAIAISAEIDRHEEGDHQAAQLLVNVPGEDWRLPDQDAGDESAEHGVHADHVGDQRHQPHDHQDRGDDGVFADEDVVGPADRQRHQPPPDREAERQEGERADDALGHAQRIDLALAGETEDDRDDDPADAVADDGGAEDHLADPAAHEVHFADHRGHDRNRGHRKRGAQEQRRHQPLARIADHGIRQQFAERVAAGERNDDPADRGGDRRATTFPHHLQVGFHPRHQQDQQHGELCHRIEHRLLLFGRREQRVLQVRKDRAEKRRAEHQPGHQHPHHRRLPQPQQHLAEQPPDQHQHDKLDDEDGIRRPP